MNPPRSATQDPLVGVARTLAENAAKTGRFGKLAEKLNSLSDARLPQLADGHIDCKPTCDYCCHRGVTGTLPEAVAITEHVQSHFSQQQQAELLTRIESLQQAQMEHFRRRSGNFTQPCPFLVDHLCSIYEHRPLSCRAIFSPSAEQCRKAFENGEDLPTYPNPLKLATVMCRVVSEAIHKAGSPSGIFDIPSSVGMLLQRGQEAVMRSNITAPVEMFVTSSPMNTGKNHPSEILRGYLDSPRFLDVWEATLNGDTETVRHLSPKLRNEQQTVQAALSMPSLYESQDQVEEAWAGLEKALTDFENFDFDPVTAYETLALAHTFYWPYTGKDVRPFLERFKKKALKDIVAVAHPQLTAPMPEIRRPGKLRVGYISRLTNFNGSKWALGWAKNHGPDIETFAFNVWPNEDEVTNAWRRTVDHYFHIPIPADYVAQFVRSLDLDVMIFTDIGMNRPDHQLGSFRLARRQFTAWGHPVTSGCPMIEGYLSSDLMEPPGAQRFYTEKLHLLPHSGVCLPRTTDRIASIDPQEFGLPSEGFYFNVQMASKNLPKDDQLYRRICEESGKPIAFLAPFTERDLEPYKRRLNAAGINAIMLPRVPVQTFLGLIACCDAVLDTPAWNGGNSTIDALYVSKPVISLATEFMRGRHSLAFLNIAGVGDLIAKDEDDYVALALGKERQHAAMQKLNFDALFEDKAPAEALNRLLLDGV